MVEEIANWNNGHNSRQQFFQSPRFASAWNYLRIGIRYGMQKRGMESIPIVAEKKKDWE